MINDFDCSQANNYGRGHPNEKATDYSIFVCGCYWLTVDFEKLIVKGDIDSDLSGKKFAGKRLVYLKILNDTTLYSSINSYTDTARFFLKNDTLFIRQK